jgi:hypothetical protein
MPIRPAKSIDYACSVINFAYAAVKKKKKHMRICSPTVISK